MKPYDDAILNEQKHYLNYRLSRARMVTEGAFGKLKRHWRVLSKKCESNPETLKRSGLASIVLYNICIEMGDIIPRNIDLTIDPSNNKRRLRNELREILQMADQIYFGTNSAEAKSIRDCLAERFWEERQGHLPKGYLPKYENLILIGDFNLSNENQHLDALTQAYNLNNLINKPT